MVQRKTLLLVDGSSYIHRAYHAMSKTQKYTDSEGKQHFTGAIHGVIMMLNSIQNKYPSDYRCCVYDASRKSFRTDLYPGYKANRSPMDESLRDQIQDIHEVTKLLGWDVLSVEGYEADDVIGTLSRKATGLDIFTTISSGDKDLAQLVNAHVKIYDSMSRKTRDIEGVYRDFGIPPDRVIDYLTLVGDTADNIPGVDKVGHKTALSLLDRYGSLDSIVANVEDITCVGPIIKNNLKVALEHLPLYRQLVTIRLDVPNLPDIGGLTHKPPNKDKLNEFYKARKLYSLLDDWYS